MADAKSRQKTWQKILYKDQGVPDYYVDDSFLDELKKNLHIRKYEYWSVVKASGVVTQQLCSVCLFVLVFVFMDIKWLPAEVLVSVSAIITVIGYMVNCYLDRLPVQKTGRTFFDDLKTATIFVGFSYCLSPVLVSLTETIATDTIYTMTTIMLLANLCLHDYGADAEMVSGVLSLNTGLFASVCLASRLHTAFHSFATVTFAVIVFALWPALRRNLQYVYPRSQVVLTTILVIVTLVTLTLVSNTAAILFVIVIIFITFVCPAWLITLQPYKNNIYGPWDEAVIQE